MEKHFRKFTLMDLIVLAMMAALGIAIKSIINPLIHIVTGPLFIPGGSVAGGFYMLFVVLGAALVRKPFSATLICVVQAIMVTVTGVLGSHGIMSFITYTAPGIGVDLLFFLLGRYRFSRGGFLAAGMVANVTGSLMVNLVFFRLPFLPLALVLALASLSGGIGGIVACALVRRMEKIFPAFAYDADADLDLRETVAVDLPVSADDMLPEMKLQRKGI